MIGFGLLGLGRFGRHYARLIPEIPGARLVASADQDFGSLLENRAIEAVVLATPAATHHDYICAALRAGKHVLVEKPMALSREEAEAIREAVVASGTCFMVGHQYRYHDAIRELEGQIHHGAFGRIKYVSATQLAPGPARTGVGAFFEMATHELAVIDFLCDPGAPREAHGIAVAVRGSGPHEDTAIASVVFTSSLAASIAVSWQAPEKIRRLDILGEHGSATFGLDKEGEVLRIYNERHELQSEVRAVREPLRVQLEHFVSCIQTGAAPETGIKHGVKITEWLAWVRERLSTV